MTKIADPRKIRANVKSTVLMCARAGRVRRRKRAPGCGGLVRVLVP